MDHFDIDAENAVLGTVFYDADLIDDVFPEIKSDHFYGVNNRAICSAIESLIERGLNIDEVTVHTQIVSSGNNNVSIAYIGNLVDYSPQIEHIKDYVKIVKDKFNLRKLATLKQSPVEGGSREAIGIHLKEISDLNDSLSVESNLEDTRSILKSVVDDCDRFFKQGEKPIGHNTGFTDLDSKTSGLQPEELIVIGARPSMGKSSIFLNIACHIAKNNTDKKVLIFSLEMSKKQLVQRMQSSIGKVELTKIREIKNLTQEEWDRIAMASGEISRLPILINDESLMSIEELCSIAKKELKKGGVSAIFIDYLGKLRYDGKYQNEEIKISRITNMTKDLAKKLNCPVVLLSQLNRSLENRPEKRPIMSDLKGSGAIEADADLIIFIYRDEQYFEDSEDKGVAELLIRKNRSGETGVVRLAFQGKYTKFSNLHKNSDFY